MKKIKTSARQSSDAELEWGFLHPNGQERKAPHSQVLTSSLPLCVLQGRSEKQGENTFEFIR